MSTADVAMMPAADAAEPTNARLPAISVVMPVYNESLRVLQRTFDSLQAQSLKDFEIVVILDNPARQDVKEFLASLAESEPRVHSAVNESNLGVWASYNRGIRLATGRYLAIQDADDESLPLRLKLLYDYLESHPDVDVVGAAIEYIDDQSGRSLMTRYYPESVASAIKRYCPLAHGTTLRKADLHKRFGYYDEAPAVRHAADYDLWLRWHARGVRFTNIPQVVYKYYQSPTNFKSLHVRRILKDTIALKRRYAASLGFGVWDHLYLKCEMLASWLPNWLIVSLFYRFNALRCWLTTRRQVTASQI
jgi:glycosyltransferase involved in cell wall biosynthesis